MKQRFTVAIILFAALLLVTTADMAQAQWDALGSGYAVTTDWHGVEVPIGQLVTATAGTTDSRVRTVEFRWLDPNGGHVWNVIVPVFGPYVTPNVPLGVPDEIADWASKYPGVTVWYAQNAQTPDVIGDWGVQAIFHDSVDHGIRGRNSDTVAIRATSFNVLPEVPFGTIALLLSMFGAFGVFALKRRHGAPA